MPCEIRLASEEAGAGQANSLQTTLAYSDKMAKPLYFSATKDAPTPINNGLTIPSGHTLTFGPSNLESWQGEGELILISLGSPYPVSEAFVNEESFEGNPTAVVLHFELLEDIPTPIPVVSSETVAGDGNGASFLPSREFNHHLPGAHVSCDVNGAPCEDGNACTINEVCIAKVCAGEVRLCDDGNICTFDFCDPEIGCFHQTVEDDCPCRPGGLHGGWILCERRMRRRDPSGLHRPMSTFPEFGVSAYVQLLQKSTLRDSMPRNEDEDHAGAAVFLRHDVDFSPELVLPIARAEAELGVRSTFYLLCRVPMT